MNKKKIYMKLDIFEKLPKAFLGMLIGITFGGIAGNMFAGMEFVPEVAWEEVFIFLGGIFGLIAGYKSE